MQPGNGNTTSPGGGRQGRCSHTITRRAHYSKLLLHYTSPSSSSFIMASATSLLSALLGGPIRSPSSALFHAFALACKLLLFLLPRSPWLLLLPLLLLPPPPLLLPDGANYCCFVGSKM